MKKNTLALNIGEEAFIEGFGIIRCIKSNIKFNIFSCLQCCMYGKHRRCMSGELVNIDSLEYCIDEYRNKKDLTIVKKELFLLELLLLLNLKI